MRKFSSDNTHLGHLPYFPFPDDWSMFPAAALVADHLEKYPEMLGLDVRTGTTAVRSEYNGHDKIWTLWLQRSDGSEFTLRSRHLVVANGVDVLGGLKPRIPQLPGLVRCFIPDRLKVEFTNVADRF
jgi:putative flavoprotein involved in K+ transport